MRLTIQTTDKHPGDIPVIMFVCGISFTSEEEKRSNLITDGIPEVKDEPVTTVKQMLKQSQTTISHCKTSLPKHEV